jgi:hypothetical protein
MLQALTGIFPAFKGMLQAHYRQLQACYRHITRMWQACYRHVIGMLQTYYMHDPSMLQACYRHVTGMLQACYRHLQACYRHVTGMLQAYYPVAMLDTLITFTQTFISGGDKRSNGLANKSCICTVKRWSVSQSTTVTKKLEVPRGPSLWRGTNSDIIMRNLEEFV